MKVLADKAVLLAGALIVLSHLKDFSPLAVAALLAAITLSAAATAWETRPVAALIPLATLAPAALTPLGLPGAPLAVYDLVRRLRLGRTAPPGPVGAAAAGPATTTATVGAVLVAVAALRWDGLALWLAGLLAAAASLLAVRTADEQSLRSRLLTMRHDLRVKIRSLEASRAELVEAQELQARAATLDERTRIARDMHDTVGHQLTRLLFQVRALQTVHAQDLAMVEALETLGSGLEESLTAMRACVHALSDNGVDLAVALHTMASSSPVPQVSVDCGLTHAPPAAVSRCLLAVVREALTNAARHGGAGSARVEVADFPGFWRVSVSNDGTTSPPPGADHGGADEGMGLRSMRERVRALGGTLRVEPRPPFTVTATIIKSGRHEP